MLVSSPQWWVFTVIIHEYQNFHLWFTYLFRDSLISFHLVRSPGIVQFSRVSSLKNCIFFGWILEFWSKYHVFACKKVANYVKKWTSDIGKINFMYLFSIKIHLSPLITIFAIVQFLRSTKFVLSSSK